MQSATISELAKALATAQGRFRPAKRSATNPALRNKYATLDDVIEAVRAPLSENGLAFVQVLGGDGEDAHTLTTTLYHESGEWIGSTSRVPSLPTNKATNKLQMLGSALTYMRRYALSALLGVSTGDGDDGNGSAKSKRTAKKKTSSPKQAAPAKETVPVKPKLPMALEDAKAIVIKGKALGDATQEQLKTMLNWALDNPEKEASGKLGKACEVLLRDMAASEAAIAESPWFKTHGQQFVAWAGNKGLGIPGLLAALSAAQDSEVKSVSATTLSRGEAKAAVDAYIAANLAEAKENLDALAAKDEEPEKPQPPPEPEDVYDIPF